MRGSDPLYSSPRFRCNMSSHVSLTENLQSVRTVTLLEGHGHIARRGGVNCMRLVDLRLSAESARVDIEFVGVKACLGLLNDRLS